MSCKKNIRRLVAPLALLAWVSACGADTNRLLVIAPKSLLPALTEFVAHKQKLLPTQLISLEAVLDKGRSGDDPEKLKRFLYNDWRESGLGYVLLVGDVDVMPVRFMTLDRVAPAAFDYAFYPSDLYYSDLAKADGSFDDWNANKDSFHAEYFGEVRGEKNKNDPINFDQVDYQPDLAVGRWPVSTLEEARLVAAKTISFEVDVVKNNNPYLRRVAAFVVGGWVDTREWMDGILQPFTNHWQIEKRYYSETNQPSGTLPPDHAQVRALLNGGLGLVLHTGHGQPHEWEQCFSVSDLDSLSNALARPVIFSAGCSTAHFAPLPPYEPYVDVNGVEHAGSYKKEIFTAPPSPPAPYQRGRCNPTGLGEEVLKRSTNGGVAYIGCNTGSQPCGLTLMEGYLAALAKMPEPRLGDCWNGAVRYYS